MIFEFIFEYQNIELVIRKWNFNNTAQKMKFTIKDLISKCDQIRRKLRIWSLLQGKSLLEKFIFCYSVKS